MLRREHGAAEVHARPPHSTCNASAFAKRYGVTHRTRVDPAPDAAILKSREARFRHMRVTIPRARLCCAPRGAQSVPHPASPAACSLSPQMRGLLLLRLRCLPLLRGRRTALPDARSVCRIIDSVCSRVGQAHKVRQPPHPAGLTAYAALRPGPGARAGRNDFRQESAASCSALCLSRLCRPG